MNKLEDENSSPEGALVVDTNIITGNISNDTIVAYSPLGKLDELHGTGYTLSLLQQGTVDRVTSFGEWKQIEASTQYNISVNLKNKDTYVPKDKFTTEMLVTGMVDIIENKSDVDTAFATVAKEHNTTDDFIKNNKNSRIYNQKEVVETVKEKSKQVKRLQDHRLFNEDNLVKSSTSNQLFDNTYKDMLILGEIDTLKKEVATLKLRQSVTEHKVESIENYLSTIPDERIYEAIRLKLDGKTYKQISDSIGVSTKTISRWLKKISTT